MVKLQTDISRAEGKIMLVCICLQQAVFVGLSDAHVVDCLLLRSGPQLQISPDRQPSLPSLVNTMSSCVFCFICPDGSCMAADRCLGPQI